MEADNICILAIESSCDDTSAAVIKDGKVLANIIVSQAIHAEWGGIVPELASRAHHQNIIPVVDKALKDSNVKKDEFLFSLEFEPREESDFTKEMNALKKTQR